MCSLLGYVTRRLLLALVSVWGVLTITFILVRLLPGDPAKLMLGLYATEELIQEQREIMGLDRPLLEQYGLYLKQFITGNWGKSLFSHQYVTSLIGQAFPNTVVLALVGLGIGLGVAFPVGVWAGVRANSMFARVVATLSLFGQSMAPFWFAIVLILVFSRWLGWAPSFGFTSVSHVVLPGMAVGLPLVGVLVRLIRAELSEQLQEDYVRSARAKGLCEAHVVLRHALRNSLIPVLTMVGMQLGSLLAGAIVVETVFAWPGIGRLMIEALGSRDYPLIQAAVAITATSYVILNLLVDLGVGVLDPRIRYD